MIRAAALGVLVAVLAAAPARAEVACVPGDWPGDLKLGISVAPARQLLLAAEALSAKAGTRRWKLTCRLPTGVLARFEAAQAGSDVLLSSSSGDALGLMQATLLSLGSDRVAGRMRRRKALKIGLHGGRLVAIGASREELPDATLRLDVDETLGRAALVVYPSRSFAPAARGETPASTDAVAALLRAYGSRSR